MSETFLMNSYPMYGLNHNRSFMTAPKCECGCGQPAWLILKEHEDVAEFCVSVLSEHECPESAVFAVFNDGHYEAFVKHWDEEDENFHVLDVSSDDMHMFADIDGEFRLCCYNLITEHEDGQWMIES